MDVPGDIETHKRFMREAIEMVRFDTPCVSYTHLSYNQAERALASDETPVGCVFVRNGEIIGRGMNDTNRSMNVSRPNATLSSKSDFAEPSYQFSRILIL